MTVIAINGFSQWPKIQALKWGFEKTMQTTLEMATVFDRDFFCSEEIESIRKQLSETLSLVHFHERKEIENYLLVPSVLDRAIHSRAREVVRRTNATIPDISRIERILEEVTEPYRIKLQAEYVEKRRDYLQRGGDHRAASTINADTTAWFENKWRSLDTRVAIVGGKVTLSALNHFLGEKYGFSITPLRIIAEFRSEEVPSDLVELLRKLDRFRKV